MAEQGRVRRARKLVCMRFDSFSFGSIQIEGTLYDHDVIIDRGDVRKRKKKASKKFQEQFGHTPLSMEEEIPWKCRQLIIGNGAYGRLPIMTEVEHEATRHKVKLLIVSTVDAIEVLKREPKHANARLHVTC